jgi:hypothetical protein
MTAGCAEGANEAAAAGAGAVAAPPAASGKDVAVHFLSGAAADAGRGGG